MVKQRTGDGERPVHKGMLNGPGSSGPNALKLAGRLRRKPRP